MLLELAPTVQGDELRRFVTGLNRGPATAALVAEWELAILYAFSRVGQTAYEELFDTRRPDIAFYGEREVPLFVADICVPSDDQKWKDNPIDGFMQAFSREIKKAGLNISNFHVTVNGPDRIHYRGGPPVTLLLPKEHELKRQVFGNDFYQFLKRAGEQPEAKHNLHLLSEGVSIDIAYEPGTRRFDTMSFGHPTFDVVYDIERNPLFQALKDKAKQLKQTGLTCQKGIIVCDGGLSLLTRMSPSGSHSMQDVLKHFMTLHQSIAFVLVMAVKAPFGGAPSLDWITMTKDGRDSLPDDVGAVISNMIQNVPPPIRNGHNAKLSWSPNCYQRASFLWKQIGSGTNFMRVTISAQTLLRLLSGSVSHDQLREGDDHPDPFAEALSKGYVITQVIFKPDTARDDDLIEIELRGPDASVSPFVVPE